MSKKDKSIKALPSSMQSTAALLQFISNFGDDTESELVSAFVEGLPDHMSAATDMKRAKVIQVYKKIGENPKDHQAKSLAKQQEEKHEAEMEAIRNAERRLEELHQAELRRIDRQNHGQRPRPQQPQPQPAQPQPAAAPVTTP